MTRIWTLLVSNLYVNIEAGSASETVCIILARERMRMMKQNIQRYYSPVLTDFLEHTGNVSASFMVWKCQIMTVMLCNKFRTLFASIVAIYFYFLLGLFL
jgi:hypothetical protein